MPIDTHVGRNRLQKSTIDTYRRYNRPLIGVGSYRLPVDLEPFVHGVVFCTGVFVFSFCVRKVTIDQK